MRDSFSPFRRVANAPLIITALLGSACGGGSKSDAGAQDSGVDAKVVTAADDYCASECRTRKRCDPMVDAPLCLDNCRLKNSVVYAHLRGDVVRAQIQCLDGLDCPTLERVHVAGCIDRVTDSIAPGEAAKGYCAAAVKRDAECSMPSTEGDCLALAKLLDDKSLQAGLDCLTKPCTSLPACRDEALGFN